jgi:predicted alpha/beta-fold hydrolase
MKYLAPAWLPGGHLQTIYPPHASASQRSASAGNAGKHQTNDFIDVDFIDGKPGQALLYCFTDSKDRATAYARALMAAVQARGWSGAIPHFRGCSGELNQAPRFYHSGDAEEINWIIRRLHAQHSKTNAAAPFLPLAYRSVEMPYYAGSVNRNNRRQSFMLPALFSAPLDLAQGGASLSAASTCFTPACF